MGNVENYNRLFSGKIRLVSFPSVKTFVPKPNELDYKRGYIRRYFVQKTNDDGSAIFEVSDNEFLKLTQSTYYKGTSIRWKITGNIIDVRTSNQKSINLGKKKIKNLGLFVSNLTQFFKKN